MNLNTPLLMGMSGAKMDSKTNALIKAMSGNADKSELISELSGNKNIAPLIKMMQNLPKEKERKLGGLSVISNIASDDILGKLTRYFYRKNSKTSR